MVMSTQLLVKYLVCHSMPALVLFGVLQRVSIKFASIKEGLVERCREKNQIRLLCGCGAVGKGRGDSERC